MNFKNLFQMEAVIGEWTSHLHLAPNTPLDIAEQMLVNFMQAIGKLKEQAEAQLAAAKNKEEDSKVMSMPEEAQGQQDEQKAE